MKNCFVFLCLLISSPTVAQDALTINVIDLFAEPVSFKGLEQAFETPDGTYLTNCRTISYFDGTAFTELYTSEAEMTIVGADANGAFVLEKIPDQTFMKNLVCIHRSGDVQVLNSSTSGQ